jgi:hypothetical protein
VTAQIKFMSKKNTKKIINKVYNNSVSSSDCTGLLQKVDIDQEQLNRYHKEFNKTPNKK